MTKLEAFKIGESEKAYQVEIRFRVAPRFRDIGFPRTWKRWVPKSQSTYNPEETSYRLTVKDWLVDAIAKEISDGYRKARWFVKLPIQNAETGEYDFRLL